MDYYDFLAEVGILADKIADNVFLSAIDKEQAVWSFANNINTIILYLKDKNEYDIYKQMYSSLLGKGIVKQEDADWQLSTLKDQVLLRHAKAVKARRNIKDICNKYKVGFETDGYLFEILDTL